MFYANFTCGFILLVLNMFSVRFSKFSIVCSCKFSSLDGCFLHYWGNWPPLYSCSLFWWLGNFLIWVVITGLSSVILGMALFFGKSMLLGWFLTSNLTSCIFFLTQLQLLINQIRIHMILHHKGFNHTYNKEISII